MSSVKSKHNEGWSMDKEWRVLLEERFGVDLSMLRIHTNPLAEAAAAALGADAFAVGNSIFFAKDRFRPETPEGLALLAHEVAHVIQQRSYSGAVGDCEREACEAGLAVARGARWQVTESDRFGTVRCAAAIKPGSADIKIDKQHPAVAKPRVEHGKVLFYCSKPIRAEGSVVLTGAQPAAGWKLGFLQAEWADTNWLYYRGQSNADGSVLLQRSRNPARPIRVCRDVQPETDIFYTDATDLGTVSPGDAFPLTLKTTHFDNPDDKGPAMVLNTKTGKNNYLREAQLEFLFCTVLAALDPAGTYHQLKSFYWNVRWQATFQPANFADPLGDWHVAPVPGGQGQAVGGVIVGEPTDKRFNKVLTDPKIRGCNALVPLYTTKLTPPHPCWRESDKWESFDITR
jgi:hypothetical protein